MIESNCFRCNETGGGNPLPVFGKCGRINSSGLLGVDLFGETGNFAGSGFSVQHPFFGRFVDGGLRRIKLFAGIFRILGDGEAQILDNVLNPGLNRFVPQAPTLILAGAFQC